AKGIGIGIGAVIALLLLIVAFFPWNRLRGPLSHALSADLHRRVSIGALHGSLFGRPHVQVSGLTIGNPAWAGGGQMVSIQRIDLELRFWPLLRGEIVLPKVALIRPDVRLYRAADGRANWVFSSNPQSANANSRGNQPPSLPLVHRLLIESGRLSARDEMHKITFDGTVDAGGNSIATGAPSQTAKTVKARAQSHGASPSSAKQRASRVAANTGTGFKLLGKGALNGKPFTLLVSGGPLVWAETHKPYPFDVQMSASDIRAGARGVLPRPFDLTQLDVTLSLSGKDLADGYYLTGLALPNTPPYSISGRLRLVGTKYEFSHVRGRLGGSDIHGVMSVQLNSARPILHADLTSHSLNLADLGPTFGGAAPSGAEEAQAQSAKGHPTKAATKHALARGLTHAITAGSAEKVTSPLLLPTARLQVDRLRAMNATLHYRADEIKAQSLPLRKVDLQLRLQDGELRIDPFAFTFPEGELAGSAQIDARERVPAERLDVRLTHVQLAQFHTKGTTKPPFEGTLVGRLRVHGRGDSMHAFASSADGTLSVVVPHGEIEQAFAELAGIDVARGLGLLLRKNQQQTALRCGIADFDAHDGVAKVKQVVFDTQVVIITGLGDVNLRDERLNLQLNGAPKKFRFAVLRSPVEITGTLRKPAIGLKASKLAAQGATATVLGAIGTPLAAIAAFVEPGLNKSADCQALLADAKRMGAPLHTAAARPHQKAPRR
ncbi:MAG: AsmA family protein, partial [Steroidobacteraceae bacterium]